MARVLFFTTFVGLLLGFFLGIGRCAAATITLGIISHNTMEEAAALIPFTVYLKEQYGLAIKFTVADTIEKMVVKIQNQDVDFFMESPYVAVQIATETGSRMVMRQWKRNAAEYQSAIVVRSDSPAASLQDFRGKIIALEDLNSTSAFFLPLAQLKAAGLSARQVHSIGTRIPPEQVGYVLVGDEQLIPRMVASGKVFGGGAKLSTVKDDKGLKIIATSAPIPRSMVSFAPHFTGPQAEKLMAAMLDMDRNPQGVLALRALFETKKFDRFPEGETGILKKLQPLFRKD